MREINGIIAYQRAYLELRTLDDEEMLPKPGTVGANLRENGPGFDAADSYVLQLMGVRDDGTADALYRAHSLMVGDCALLTDVCCRRVIRQHGFHKLFMASRCAERALLAGLPHYRILAIPQLSVIDWSHKMGSLRFVPSASSNVPPEIQNLKQPVYHLSNVGLHHMFNLASTAFPSGTIILDGKEIPFENRLRIASEVFREEMALRQMGSCGLGVVG